MKAPAPKESADHRSLIELIEKLNLLRPGWRYTHVPNGEKRDPRDGAKLKAMGTSPGFPDLVFFGPGMVFALELKRRGQPIRMSIEQLGWRDHFTSCGFAHLVTNDLQDAVDQLFDCGVLRATVQVAA